MVLLQNTWPDTHTLFKATRREVGKRFEIGIDENRTADLLVFSDRINVYVQSNDNSVAMLRFETSFSGSLWLRGELVGEFIQDAYPSGSFVVVEVEDGFKRPTPPVSIDPIYYLLQHL